MDDIEASRLRAEATLDQMRAGMTEGMGWVETDALTIMLHHYQAMAADLRTNGLALEAEAIGDTIDLLAAEHIRRT